MYISGSLRPAQFRDRGKRFLCSYLILLLAKGKELHSFVPPDVPDTTHYTRFRIAAKTHESTTALAVLPSPYYHRQQRKSMRTRPDRSSSPKSATRNCCRPGGTRRDTLAPNWYRAMTWVVQGLDLQHLCEAYQRYNAVIRDVCYDILSVVNRIFSVHELWPDCVHAYARRATLRHAPITLHHLTIPG